MSVETILYVRFDINAVEEKSDSSAYGSTCYKIVFKNVRANVLNGCKLYMGDSRATLNGSEYVCIIGLSAPLNQLETIREVLQNSEDFKSVAASNSLILTSNGSEPLVFDGVFTEDGALLQCWAKLAYDSYKETISAEKQSSIETATSTKTTSAPSDHIKRATELLEQEETEETEEPQRHGCLTTWLILVVVVNVGLAFFLNSLQGTDATDKISYIIAAIISVVGAVLIWNWKKIGFWIFAGVSVLGFIFGLIAGEFGTAIQSLAPLAILYIALQKESNGVSGWNNLK